MLLVFIFSLHKNNPLKRGSSVVIELSNLFLAKDVRIGHEFHVWDGGSLVIPGVRAEEEVIGMGC